MRAFILFLICVTCAHCFNLTEIFRDDFHSQSLNVSKWNSTSKNNTRGLEYYTSEDVTVENGSLVITTKNETSHGKNYTSGRVDTQKSCHFQYGEIEFSAKVPRGRGILTAFFLYDSRCGPVTDCQFSPPSITVIDIRGDRTHEVYTTVFFEGGNQSSSTFSSPVDFSEDFHLYKLLWTPEELVWFVDNQSVFRVNDSQKIPHTPMQIVMTVTVGTSFSGAPDETTVFPAHLYVNYVVVRQQINEPFVDPVKKSKLLQSILGPIGGFSGLLAVIVGIVLLRIHRKKQLTKGNMNKFSSDIHLTARFNPSWSKNFAIDLEFQLYISLVEVPLANLEISDDLLGSGEYGMVHKGLVRGLRGQPEETVVAIKSALPSCSPEIKALFLEEMKLMTKVGRHLNIVNLLGIVCKGTNLLILEYCAFGSLIRYLKTHRGAYLYIHVDDSGILLPFDKNEHKRLEDEAAELHRRQTFPEENFDVRVLSTNDCINFAYQISRGMEFLASKQIIHRDLAARNILVSQNKIVKVSDFGLARQNEGEGDYLSSAHVALPVKWMPPESIVQKKFSEKSDVWSYGILLWEIFSIGEVPFSNSGVGSYVTDLVASLENGFQMERPSAAPLEMYLIMKKCWNLNVAQRPNFAELRLDLQKFVHETIYLELDLPYQEFNSDYLKLLSEPKALTEKNEFVVAEET